jgi:hypothetical protein
LEARLSEGHGRVLRAEDWTPWGEHRLKVEQQLCGMQGREHWCVARGLCRGGLKVTVRQVPFIAKKDSLLTTKRPQTK